MARQQSKIQTASFVGGFITEASPLTFPENSCLDINNVDLNQDGSVSRRKGLDLEADHQEFPYTVGVAHDYSCHPWRAVAGRSNLNLIVVKAGRYLLFYKEGSTLSANKEVFEIDLLTKKVFVALDADVINDPVSLDSGKGFLFVTGKYIEPFSVEYDDQTDTYTITDIILKERDFDGVDDGLDVTTRPSTLSSEHEYNLLNQGWTTGTINTYRSASGVYPSNAQIWHVGKDAENNFSPAELNRVNFGNTPAPKGRFINDVFGDDELPPAPIDHNISSATLDCVDEEIVITLSTAHGASVGDNVRVEGTAYNWVDGTDSGVQTVNGLYQVARVVSTTVIAINITSEFCSLFDSWDTLGTVTTNPVINPEGIVGALRPRAVCFYAGRAFYAGIESPILADNVYFSQILTDVRKAGRCYQDADPTSEDISDIIDTDGGRITITGLGTVVAMVPLRRSLLLFSQNGVWEVSGESEGFFRATGYSARRISNIPCLSPKAVVEVEGTVMFFAEDGIYNITENNISGLLEAQSITDNTIRSYYLSIRDTCKRNASAAYDYRAKKAIWLHRYAATGCPKQFDSALVLDLRTGAFTKYTFNIDVNYPVGICPVRDISNADFNLKYLVVLNDLSLSFAELNNEEFLDWGEHDSEGLVVTGYTVGGDLGTKKSARQLILHMIRTETGFKQVGDSLQAINPSGCKVRIAWDFSNDVASNKWGAEFQGYRYRQLYTPTGPADTYNTGYEVITSKTKLRGTGRAFTLRFRTEPGKDMRILGWSIAGDAEGVE